MFGMFRAVHSVSELHHESGCVSSIRSRTCAATRTGSDLARDVCMPKCTKNRLCRRACTKNRSFARPDGLTDRQPAGAVVSLERALHAVLNGIWTPKCITNAQNWVPGRAAARTTLGTFACQNAAKNRLCRRASPRIHISTDRMR
eukprot:gene8727-biopygen13695